MFNYNAFSIARLPKIDFGPGAMTHLPDYINQYGKHALIVTGAKSYIESRHWQTLNKALNQHKIKVTLCHVITEPSPEFIDQSVSEFKHGFIDVVVAIGGGSAIDAGKAIAGLLRIDHSVMDFLEGVGPELDYTGPAVPFIAAPTTAGTGSEATKNAVLSRQSFDGFKKSFRDEQLVPDVAILDPELLDTCPPSLIAANGMDALTQLMESYVSIRANQMTDTLALDGMQAVRDSLLNWYKGENTIQHRTKMAYASMLSGITLAQVGLGSVHGLASPLGAFFPIPHGTVCGTLVAEATAVNLEAMLERDDKNIALKKYANIGRLLAGDNSLTDSRANEALVAYLFDLTEKMDLPLLNEYGVRAEQLDHIVAHSRGSSMKTNPVVLTDDEIRQILFRRLSA